MTDIRQNDSMILLYPCGRNGDAGFSWVESPAFVDQGESLLMFDASDGRRNIDFAAAWIDY